MTRRLLVSSVVAVALALPLSRSLAGAGPDALGRIAHIVVVYEENHSFDNLYGSWEGTNGLAQAGAASVQVAQDGRSYTCLLQNDPNLTSPPLTATCADAAAGVAFVSHFENAPFTIDPYIPPTANTCPSGVAGGEPGGCTRDLVHRFYQEQYQLNGGRQNRYVTGSDAVGLAMGLYDTRALPIYRYLHEDGHPRYAIAERFHQAAFGGSFLNHQWVVAATTPVWPNAVNDGSTNDLHSVVDENGMPVNYPLYMSPLGTAVRDAPLTASCTPGPGRAATPPGVVCGDYAVNTIQPVFQPYAPGTALSRRLPPQTAPTIGDRLSAAGIDWAWYSGGWSNANGDVNGPGWTNGSGPSCSDPRANPAAVWPNCPDRLFQFHHQPFNYYQAFAPGTTARSAHLRDEQEFLQTLGASTKTCNLKRVSFVKPVGAENEHPGYASEANGSQHLVDLLRAIEGSACGRDTLVVVTYDEFGGGWDHVPPPGLGGTTGVHDVWGPGTRIPAIVIAPFLRGNFVVDRTPHDTTSILATIERRFGLTPLGPRDAAVSDLSSVFVSKAALEDDQQ